MASQEPRDRIDEATGVDRDIQDLLAGMRPREQPSEEARTRVRGAIYRAWQELPDQRSSRRVIPWAFAASAAMASVLVYVAAQHFLVHEPEQQAIAQILHESGGYAVRGEGNLGTGLPAGATISTSSSGRLVIRLGGNVSLRLDTGSQVTLEDRDEVALGHGRLFVDSKAFLERRGGSRFAEGSRVEVTTPQGVSVRNTGTQFAVWIEDRRTSIAVREGTVRMSLGDASTTASAMDGIGEVIEIEDLAEVSRQPLAATDARWAWIHRAQSDFDLESASVLEFVHWASREQGLALAFESDAVRHHASMVRLHGPRVAPAELNRADVVDIVETAPSFRIASTEDYRLVVGFKRE